jgi:hypothetical protein
VLQAVTRYAEGFKSSAFIRMGRLPITSQYLRSAFIEYPKGWIFALHRSPSRWQWRYMGCELADFAQVPGFWYWVRG